jgi:aminoglycoside phosphotransferase
MDLSVAAVWSALKGVRPTVIAQWKRGQRMVSRLDDLEKRVGALEKSLERQPAEACPFCGELAMRLDWAGGAIAADGGRSSTRLERWKCRSCGQSESRMTHFGGR